MQYKVFKINLLSAESTYDLPEGWNPGKILYSSEEMIIMMIEKYTPQNNNMDLTTGYTIPYQTAYTPVGGITTAPPYTPGVGGAGRLY